MPGNWYFAWNTRKNLLFCIKMNSFSKFHKPKVWMNGITINPEYFRHL